MFLLGSTNPPPILLPQPRFFPHIVFNLSISTLGDNHILRLPLKKLVVFIMIRFLLTHLLVGRWFPIITPIPIPRSSRPTKTLQYLLQRLPCPRIRAHIEPHSISAFNHPTEFCTCFKGFCAALGGELEEVVWYCREFAPVGVAFGFAVSY